jgi:Putative peptidoglycan binding domain
VVKSNAWCRRLGRDDPVSDGVDISSSASVRNRAENRRGWESIHRSGVPVPAAPVSGALPITRNRRREKVFGFARARTPRLDGVKSMRNPMLATASAIVLGMAGAGIGHAAELNSSPTNPLRSAIDTSRAMTASEILITAAQQQLKYSGLYNGSVDGKMSSETQQALRQFQQQHGLRQSGTLDEKTYTALQGDTGQVGSSRAPGGQPSAAAGSDYTSGSGRNSARRHQ